MVFQATKLLTSACHGEMEEGKQNEIFEWSQLSPQDAKEVMHQEAILKRSVSYMLCNLQGTSNVHFWLGTVLE